MKLWRRRPLSVDLTERSLGVCNEMPPSLVYISPGIQCISKRSSITNNEILPKPQYFSDVSSFNSTEKCITTRSNTVENCPLQSFRDNMNNTSVSFEDGTMRSSRLSNKSYISPVSAEWFPVKDVMKIKRSASVPFHSAQNVTSLPKPPSEIPAVTVKSHSSLAEKIRTLFRTRSSSRSSKTVLAPITEIKGDKGKVCLRNSRTRNKEIEACKSMYESSRVHDQEFSEKLNNVLRDCATRPTEHISKKDARKMQNEKPNKKNDKLVTDKKQKLKDYHMHWDGQKISSSTKGFSDSVVSHTASSAAKCKPSPPKILHDSHRIKPSVSYRSSDNQVDKKPIVKSNSCKYELQFPRELSQPITSQNYDKKSCEPNKSDSFTGNSGRIDNGKNPQRRESRLLNQLSGDCKEERPELSKRTSSIQKPDEDDYVTLAQVDLQLQAPYSFMTQSIHGPIIRELAKSNHEYENIDLRKYQLPSDNCNPQSPVILKYSSNPREPATSSPGLEKEKRRPISCIGMVDSDKNKPPVPSSSRYSSREPPRNMNPKSPYLSQYTKLYSLKLTNGEIMYTQQPDQSEIMSSDIMTRSQTSCPYKSPAVLGKEASGKRSIDSGMVDDMSINFHQDNGIMGQT